MELCRAGCSRMIAGVYRAGGVTHFSPRGEIPHRRSSPLVEFYMSSDRVAASGLTKEWAGGKVGSQTTV